MPKSPRGQKRPGDVIGATVMVARIATDDIDANDSKAHSRAGGKLGGAQIISYQLEDLLIGMTPQSMHLAFDWGDDVGREVVEDWSLTP